ncbi:AAA family ATPase [Xanthomonas sp. NCPPB 2632]|uniref:AAA family ATPase n=1 Tax=Xanthomonas sp. NCPPB 2632 TaxID=3240912 RepID=UPI00351803B4
MQYVDRGNEPPPQTLTGSVPKMLRDELLVFMDQSEERRAQSYPGTGVLNLEEGGMQDALRRLFKGRCAFCESSVDTRILKFRPRGEAEPYVKSEYAHLYYCWLDLAWQNFYPACYSCMPEEQAYFPVRGPRAAIPGVEVIRRYVAHNNGLWPADDYPPKEDALLLDPCHDRDFQRHFWIGPEGLLEGTSRKGAETIIHFHLNASKLVDARRQRHKEYRHQLRSALQNQRGVSEKLFRFDELEFGGTWYLLLRSLWTTISKLTGSRAAITRHSIGNAFRRLSLDGQGFIFFDRAETLFDRERSAPSKPVTAPLRRPSHARLSKVEIVRFKAIEHLQLTMPDESASQNKRRRAPALLILGENATGKSSILEAIALALAKPAARNALNISDNDLILSHDYFGQPYIAPSYSTQVTVTLSEGTVHHVKQLNIGSRIVLPPLTSSDEEVPVFAYGAFRKYGDSHSRRFGKAHIANLFDASDLPNPEKWLSRLPDDRFAMITRALRTILSIDAEFDVLIRDPEKGKCYLVTAFRADGEPASIVPLRRASSGYRSVLAMACDVMHGLMNRSVYRDFESLHTARGVILIDEIEAHLHPRWKIAIVDALREALPNMTFILTTHDPLCLRGMDDNEVVVIRRTGQGHGVVEKLENIPPISLLRVEQLLTSDLFQLNSTDDHATDSRMARIATLLAEGSREGLDRDAVEAFRREIASALPIGTSEAQRVVQEAVAEYLQERASMRAEQMSERRAQVRRRIIDALKGTA